MKVVSKILKRKERNCAFENLSLRCGATKKKLADLRSSIQYAQLCSYCYRSDSRHSVHDVVDSKHKSKMNPPTHRPGSGRGSSVVSTNAAAFKCSSFWALSMMWHRCALSFEGTDTLCLITWWPLINRRGITHPINPACAS
jgi:hypothetical protein